jgi:hypothetical protein
MASQIAQIDFTRKTNSEIIKSFLGGEIHSAKVFFFFFCLFLNGFFVCASPLGPASFGRKNIWSTRSYRVRLKGSRW